MFPESFETKFFDKQEGKGKEKRIGRKADVRVIAFATTASCSAREPAVEQGAHKVFDA